jgi:hypothetical protein
VITVPAGEDSQEDRPMPQNHNQQEEEDIEKEEEDGNNHPACQRACWRALARVGRPAKKAGWPSPDEQ